MLLNRCFFFYFSFGGQKGTFHYQFRKDILEKHSSKSCNLENPERSDLSAEEANRPPCALLFPFLFFFSYMISHPISLLTISTSIMNLIQTCFLHSSWSNSSEQNVFQILISIDKHLKLFNYRDYISPSLITFRCILS